MNAIKNEPISYHDDGWWQINVIKKTSSSLDDDSQCWQLNVIKVGWRFNVINVILMTFFMTNECHQGPLMMFVLTIEYHQGPLMTFVMSNECHQGPLTTFVMINECNQGSLMTNEYHQGSLMAFLMTFVMTNECHQCHFDNICDDKRMSSRPFLMTFVPW